ncbi:6-pyruvoyl tetrahydrobiopterin synthase [Methanocaldococcus villosus KIN24-T80]|uniref:6-pyruvoyl tetrahydrobiopterin synthase n=1 Tax=Methanocaldococcus villosus KIN24-T80 TaxID=1069083 RepID=N6VX98_9EURY|nr:6-carboxytetrahydropterin synthase QueD [Methanocaldococcus villosus]ENN95742.1 6-pyruvoyl tetrahydrobiopterin synthase [Methanocaldococcus villosus KIN24-T80]
MIIEIVGLYANLKFSSAHIVFGHRTCGVIHGHTYYVDIKVCGDKGEFNFVCDFKIIKEIVKEICKKIDHKLILPRDHKDVYYELRDKALYFKYKNKEYIIPVEDVILLPIETTSAEDLAKFFAEEIISRLKEKYKNVYWIEVAISEGLGQKAIYKLEVKHCKE